MDVREIPLEGPIDVIIADDHAIVRDGIRSVLEREAGEFRVVGEAADIPSMVKLVRELKPDLLTLDLTMPGGSSLGALPQVFMSHPTLAVAILTMREDPEYARQALRAGARSYVLKEAEPAELLQAFRTAVAGGNYLHPRLGAQMAAGNGAQAEEVALSEREAEVINLIADGFTNPEIAEQLRVAERTVKTYRARAIEKLGISSRAEITAYVRRSSVRPAADRDQARPAAPGGGQGLPTATGARRPRAAARSGGRSCLFPGPAGNRARRRRARPARASRTSRTRPRARHPGGPASTLRAARGRRR